MDRRQFLALVSSGVAASVEPLGISAALTSAGQADSAQQAERPRYPNVILMICDDLGYGDLGCYSSKIPTPNLDAMAAAGLRFTHFNAAHPICSASRAGLLTGRYGTRSKTTGAFGPGSPVGTSLDERLLSDLFRSAGYKTMAIGKWHLGDAPAYLPTNRGFDSFYGVPYSDDMYPLPLMRDLEILEKDTNREELTPRYTEEALRFIQKQGRHPFFLYLGYSYPHDPAKASRRFRGKTKLGDFGDSIAEIDWSVGEILKTLKQRNLESDTFVIFTSDHGPWYQGSPGLLRGRKASTFEGGFRVPCLMQWTGKLPHGHTYETWSSNLDILPTLSKICSLPASSNPLDGIDLSGNLLGKAPPPADPPRLYFSPLGDGGLNLHCVRKGPWKLRVAQGTNGEIYLNDRTTSAKVSAWLPHPELYDLSIDPAESYDLAKQNPDIVSELMSTIETLMPSFPADVTQAYARLKLQRGDISTPPGASPRPVKLQPNWDWEPADRRPNG